MAIRFSIVITSYNQPAFIPDAVNSAFSLDGDDYEIIVVDDGSTDGSQMLLNEYGDAIQLVCLPTNQGKGAARNRGAALARGDYLVFLDGDDALLPWALEVYRLVIDTSNPALILATMSWFEGPIPATPPEWPAAVQMIEHADYFSKDRPFAVSASSVVIRRQAFEQVGGWSRLPVMQDQDLVIRLGIATRAIQVLSPSTTLHRAHAGQSIRNVSPFLEVFDELLRKEHRGEFPGGAQRHSDRAALLGGLAFFWSKRAFKAGLRWRGIQLLVRTSPLALTAAIHRLRFFLLGARKPTTLTLARRRARNDWLISELPLFDGSSPI